MKCLLFRFRGIEIVIIFDMVSIHKHRFKSKEYFKISKGFSE